jgi:RNA polymerase sigma-70 factor (ECF subfamily)
VDVEKAVLHVSHPLPPGPAPEPPRGPRSAGAPAARAADPDAERQQVLADLYGELRRRAERFMRGQPRDQTLQVTALVHETCLKLFGHEGLTGSDRAGRLALASKAMRSVLVDHARARGRRKRMPPGARLPLDELQAAFEERSGDLLALDAALERLAALDPLMARAVELHFFGGLSLAETALALEVPMRTLERRWRTTRDWLKAEVEGAR